MTHTPRLIAFIGRTGVGKTTAVDALSHELARSDPAARIWHVNCFMDVVEQHEALASGWGGEEPMISWEQFREEWSHITDEEQQYQIVVLDDVMGMDRKRIDEWYAMCCGKHAVEPTTIIVTQSSDYISRTGVGLYLERVNLAKEPRLAYRRELFQRFGRSAYDTYEDFSAAMDALEGRRFMQIDLPESHPKK